MPKMLDRDREGASSRTRSKMLMFKSDLPNESIDVKTPNISPLQKSDDLLDSETRLTKTKLSFF
jgi:hypothetical protein